MEEGTRQRLRRLVSLFPNGVVRPLIYILGLTLTAQLLHAVVEHPRDAEIPHRQPEIALADNPIPPAVRRAAIVEADEYFIGELGLTAFSPVRIPGTRRC